MGPTDSGYPSHAIGGAILPTLPTGRLVETRHPPLSWRWLAATDPTAPPGRIRLQLETLEQVQLIISHIHGRSLQFGSDLVAIEIQNDLLDAQQVRLGNGNRGLL